MATHSSALAWKIPWTEEPGGLQSMGSQRVGHDWATSLSLFTFLHWRRKWQPTPVFLPGESQGQGSLGGLLSMGSHRVRHDWSDLAAAASRTKAPSEKIQKKKRATLYVVCYSDRHSLPFLHRFMKNIDWKDLVLLSCTPKGCFLQVKFDWNENWIGVNGWRNNPKGSRSKGPVLSWVEEGRK